jgi:putative MATE family efflux protein
MSSMRATGDTRLPSMLMVIAAAANIALDPVLIFGFGPVPAMGLNGAAMAALLARAAIFVGTLYLMRMRLDMLTFNKPDPGELRKSWADILHVGIPAAATNAIIPVATGVITAMLARYGTEAVAGFGVASRVESLTLVMFYAMSAVIGPFVGQNMAAGKADRIFLALRLCAIFCIGAGLVIAVLLAGLGNLIPMLFSENPNVTGVATQFLYIVPISYGAYGVVMIMNASFNGMGKPMPAVHISLARMVLIYLPLAFVGNRYFGVTGIFVAYAIANIITGIIAFAWARSSVPAQCALHAAPPIVG